MSVALLGVLADIALRSTVVAVLVGIVLLLWRVHDVRVHYAAWSAVLLAMLLMPALTSVLPAIAVPLRIASIQAGDSVPSAEPAAGAVPRAFSPAQAQPSSRSRPADVQLSMSPSAHVIPADQRMTMSPVSASQMLTSIYLVVLAFLTTRLGLGWAGMRRVMRTGRQIDFAAERPSILPLAGKIEARESPLLHTPVVLGVIASHLLLPVSWRQWSDDTLRAVVGHEMAHLRRRDPLMRLVARLNRCVFWFHPLAWWLDRRLALAEQACDDAALAVTNDRHAYARVLVDFARNVHRLKARVLWPANGMEGSGSVEQRIDRVLTGVRTARVSRGRLAAVVLSTFAAVSIGAACRQTLVVSAYDLSAADEQREEQLRAVLGESMDVFPRERPRRPPTADEIRELEAVVDRTPSDLDALDRLLLAYWASFAPVEPGQPPRVAPADPLIVAHRRDRILRLIEHEPASALAGRVHARLFRVALQPAYFPGDRTVVPGDWDGYERAKALWLAHAQRPDATLSVLKNAALFLEADEKPLAEQLLMKTRAFQTSIAWSADLGRFYGRVLAGSAASVSTTLVSVPAAAPNSPYGQVVRAKLAESSDAALLTAAGLTIARAPRGSGTEYEKTGWAIECLERAIRLAPKSVLAHAELLQLRTVRFASPLRTPPVTQRYAEVAALPEAERFERLPNVARNAVADLEGMDRFHDYNLSERAALQRSQAEQAVGELLRLAPRYRNTDAYGTAIYVANMTLGTLAMRDGNRAKAVGYLRDASRAPVSEELAYSSLSNWRAFTLPTKLLAAGERDAVADYMDRMAVTSLVSRQDLKEAAAAIRRGDKPPNSPWPWY